MTDSALSEQIERLVADIAQRPDDPALAPESIGIATCDGLMDELIYSMLVWEAGGEIARSAMERMACVFVDANELRVCHSSEIASVLGVRYPKGVERAERIAAALRAIYDRENRLSLEHLRESPKREARAQLEALAGLPRFVAARLVLLRLEGHALPLDERLLGLLKCKGIELEGGGADEACGRLERAVRAADARAVYLALEALSDSSPRPSRSRMRKASSGS